MEKIIHFLTLNQLVLQYCKELTFAIKSQIPIPDFRKKYLIKCILKVITKEIRKTGAYFSNCKFLLQILELMQLEKRAEAQVHTFECACDYQSKIHDPSSVNKQVGTFFVFQD